MEENSHLSPLIAMVAGEPSGDILGAGIISAFKKIYPKARFVGIAGPRMIAAGCEPLFPMEDLAVMGLFELLSSQLIKILKIRRAFFSFCLKNPPDFFIGIDSPDFNLSLEKKLKAHHIQTIHYVSPSIWAWRQGRIRLIRKACDWMLTLFPFEKLLYDQAKIPAAYVGHPLADEIEARGNVEVAKTVLKLPSNKKIVALLPGSRHGEIARMGPLFLETAQRCYEKNPNLHFVIPCVNETRYEELKTLQKDFNELPITFFVGKTHEVLSAAEVALITSGTATLEAALLQCPMVMAYKTSSFSAPILPFFLKIRRFSLPNILLNAEVVPEYLQKKATPSAMAEELLLLLEKEEKRETMLKQFQSLHETLKQNSHDTTARLLQTLFLKQKAEASTHPLGSCTL